LWRCLLHETSLRRRCDRTGHYGWWLVAGGWWLVAGEEWNLGNLRPRRTEPGSHTNPGSAGSPRMPARRSPC
jgi:hypothetical protein